MKLTVNHIATSDHKIYNLNILRRVELRIHYTANLSNTYDVFNAFMTGTFNTPIEREAFEAMAVYPIRLTQNNREIACKITDDFIEVTYNHVGYKSFNDSMLPIIEAFKVLLTSINANITRVSIEKVNAQSINAGVPVSNNKILRNLLSPDCLKADSYRVKYVPDGNDLYIVYCNNEDNDIEIFTLYAVEKIDNPKDARVASVRIVARTVENINPLELDTTARLLNDKIYDIFHAMIHPNILDIMSLKLEKA